MKQLLVFVVGMVFSSTLAYGQWQFLGETHDGQDGKIEPSALSNLATIVSEPEGGKLHVLQLQSTSQNTIKALIRKSRDDRQIITGNDLINKSNVLARTQGIDALVLHCEGCNLQEGGKFVLQYVYNGVRKSYRSFAARLKRTNDKWHLETLNGTRIHKLRLVSRKIFGRVVGIKRIVVN